MAEDDPKNPPGDPAGAPPAKAPKGKHVKLEVVLPAELEQGVYVNMARVFHNPTEFILDALFLPPQSTRAHVRSRTLMNPTHAKILHAALGQNIRLYEQNFGPIKVPKLGSDDPGPILH